MYRIGSVSLTINFWRISCVSSSPSFAIITPGMQSESCHFIARLTSRMACSASREALIFFCGLFWVRDSLISCRFRYGSIRKLRSPEVPGLQQQEQMGPRRGKNFRNRSKTSVRNCEKSDRLLPGVIFQRRPPLLDYTKIYVAQLLLNPEIADKHLIS